MTRAEALLCRQMSTELSLEKKQHLWWSNVTGDIEYVEGNTNDNYSMKPSGKIIDKANRPSPSGFGDVMLLPMEMQLAGVGVMGAATLLGKEEAAARKVAVLHWNKRRHAVPLQESEMDMFSEAPWKAWELKRGELAYWHAQVENYDITMSMYEGLSENLSTSTTDATLGNGLGIAKRYHPNFYYYLGTSATNGTLTRLGSAGKFPTAAEVYAGANISVTGATYGTMTSYTVMKAWSKVQELGIRQVQIEGALKFWVWLISPQQAITLLDDARYIAAQNAIMWKNAKDHPLLNGALGYYMGFVFYIDPITVRGVYSADAGTTIDFLGTATQASSTTNKSNPRFLPMEGRTAAQTTETVYNHVSMILGAGAMGLARKKELAFAEELIDYGEWKGLGAGQTYGYERMDYIRHDQVGAMEGSTGVAAATNVYNKSSMLVMTWQLA